MSGEYQGDERKRTTDEVSKISGLRQNWKRAVIPGQIQEKPVYCVDGVRYEGSVNLIWAFVGNVGTCRLDVKGEAQVEITHELSTDAGHRGGITRSSDEVL